ncbi:hypothetical protein [Pontibacter russatus]|uniref:hypothetical protein n=1 Tax=Pontibacter russatus TaxID=2694929 RepID=UPI00137A5218|nr:hypothetical protein [Pontibacter russatus]
MKNLIRIAWFIAPALLVITSCEPVEEVTPAGPDMSTENTLNASSRPIIYKVKEQIDFSEQEAYFFTGCNDDLLKITDGILRINYTITEHKDKVTFQYHSNTSNFRLLDETMGMAYVGSWVDNYKESFNLYNFYPYTVKETINLVFTTPGKGNNIKIKADLRIRIDANGNIKTYIDNYRIDCQK